MDWKLDFWAATTAGGLFSVNIRKGRKAWEYAPSLYVYDLFYKNTFLLVLINIKNTRKIHENISKYSFAGHNIIGCIPTDIKYKRIRKMKMKIRQNTLRTTYFLFVYLLFYLLISAKITRHNLLAWSIVLIYLIATGPIKEERSFVDTWVP